MNCVICNKDSCASRSVEHIIPESLGNTRYILPKGFVCDDCNNHFATKIERPLLEMPFFKQLRYRLSIESKKGRIPSDNGFMIRPELSEVIFTKNNKTGAQIVIPDKTVQKKIEKRKRLPVFSVEYSLFDLNSITISRFLAKVAIEALTFDVIRFKGEIEQVVNQSSFDLIKRYCRYPKKNELWPYTIRQINILSHHQTDLQYGKLNSLIFHYSFIYTSPGYLFLQLYISGVELTIDMSNPITGNINTWFLSNPGKSRVLESALIDLQEYPNIFKLIE